eukprot:COSAG01_NODE_3092_length_6596_cov_28.917193_5_plen_113_part_00
MTATFKIPTVACSFGIGLMTSGGWIKPTQEAFVDFVPSTGGGAGGVYNVSVGIRGGGGGGGGVGSRGQAADVLQLLPSDSEIEIRIFMDNTFAEVYFMNGRVAITHTMKATP